MREVLCLSTTRVSLPQHRLQIANFHAPASLPLSIISALLILSFAWLLYHLLVAVKKRGSVSI